MHPNRPIPIFLYQQLIKLLLRFICVIEENGGIAKCLLNPRYLNIHRTSSKMITRSRPTNLPIQLRRSISRVNPNRFLSIYFPSSLGYAAWLVQEGRRGQGWSEQRIVQALVQTPLVSPYLLGQAKRHSRARVLENG